MHGHWTIRTVDSVDMCLDVFETCKHCATDQIAGIRPRLAVVPRPLVTMLLPTLHTSTLLLLLLLLHISAARRHNSKTLWKRERGGKCETL